MVDLTRLFAIGRLDFLFRIFLAFVWVPWPVVDAALSAPSFRSLSQSSMFPILIAIESLSVDTRLPYIQKNHTYENEREKTHKLITHEIWICKYVCSHLWLNCNNWFSFRCIMSREKSACFLWVVYIESLDICADVSHLQTQSTLLRWGNSRVFHLSKF